MTHLNVAVRVRPLSEREKHFKAIPIVDVRKNVVSVTNLKVPEHYAGDSRERVRRFSFDYCFDSNSSQENVFNVIDNVIGDAIKKKYHSCILAYGQSSSGKTHTMMGFNEDPGLTPRLCEKIFSYLKGTDADEEDVKNVTISYLEIHNEKVNDLLISTDTENYSTHHSPLQTLRVREHPTRGTYVQGLTERRVSNSDALLDWLSIGNNKRRVSATSVNSRSSRSHSVVTIKCLGGVKLSLVDLAGSERTGSRTYTTSTFREGANINKSLVALGNVVSALADQSSKYTRGFRKRFVPYRDSVLTWLLKDTLSGNSQTVMIATISSSSTCYNETVNTLRFGHRAKQVVAQPLVNEDPKHKIIRDLKGEISRLKELLLHHKINPDNPLENQSKEPEQEKTLLTNVCADPEINQTLIQTADESTNTEDDFYNNENIIPYFYELLFDRLKNIIQQRIISNLNEDVIFSEVELFSEIDDKHYRYENGKYLEYEPNKLNDSFNIDLLNDIHPDAIHNIINIIIKKYNKDFDYYHGKRFDFTKNFLENQKRNTWKVDLSKDSDILCLKTEKLIPVMDVTTNSHVEKPIVKLRRTYSVCSDMDGRKAKMYGSHETLASASSSRVEKMKKSQSTTLRKTSLDKSSQSLKSLLLKKDDEKKSLAKVEAKVDSIRKAAGKPRSEIVAAVTQRLYTKVKKKEAATETEETPREHKGTMARPRLQDITQRAIKYYYKKKHTETQTEANPVKRVKDISTDVSDLKIDLILTKHANISTEITKRRDMGITCNFLGGFENNDLNSLKLTSSCGVQVDDSNINDKKDSKEQKLSNVQSNHLISFTKYLRGNDKLISSAPTNPIYTSSVNINVSHNYISGSNNKAGSISGDSLDDQNLQAVCLPTPDLISNHNSLEPQQTVQEPSLGKDKQELSYARTEDIPEQYNVNEQFESKFGESCNAKYSLVPQLIEQAGIDLASVYAPEIHLTKKPERCNFLNNSQPKLCKPNITEENDSFGDIITVKEPQILKSIMKHNNLHCEQQFSSDSESTDISADTFDNVPDSLNYHINKKVHFTEEQGKNGHMFEAMTNFLKEATNLMNNLSVVASKLDKNSDQGYEMQVTINDISKIVPCKQRKRYKKKCTKKPENICHTFNTYYENTSCQTTPKKTSSRYTETEIPQNKYEVSVREACDRLEQCTNRLDKRTERTPMDESSLHRFPQPFSVTDWNDFSSLQPEDSSLESNPTYSDYGSLPRRKVKHKSLLSPSAYLRQLTNMRKHIIDSARDELINETAGNIE